MQQVRRNTSAIQKSPLDYCKALIEQQLAWGDSARWTSRDYEELSLRIQEKTGRAISATTLKRIWGRVTYTSHPSQYSLTTLAVFLGYASWRAFAATLANDPAAPTSRGADTSSAVSARRIPRPILYLCWSIVVVGGALVFWMGVDGSPGMEQDVRISEEILFRSRPVAQGLPNTVIFDYDVRGVAADSFFIQQSWDQRRRTPISPQRHTLTSIYYYPGFFRAKLIANDSILREHPVHVKTEGWLTLIEHDPVPIYVKPVHQPSDGYLTVPESWFEAQGYAAQEDPQFINFFNVRDFGLLDTDNFSLETAIRRQVDDGRYPCQRAEIIVMGEQNSLIIPMSIPGCVGEMKLRLGNVLVSGVTNDLSMFGTDLSVWQPVRLTVSDGNVRIQVGSNAPYRYPLASDVGRVVGLGYRFEGMGAIDYVTLQDGQGHTVYEEAF